MVWFGLAYGGLQQQRRRCMCGKGGGREFPRMVVTVACERERSPVTANYKYGKPTHGGAHTTPQLAATLPRQLALPLATTTAYTGT